MRAAQRWSLPVIGTSIAFALLGWFTTNLFLTGSRGFALAFAGAVALAIPAIALAWYRPIVFPLGLYAAALPFDNIAQLGSLTSVTRLLGAVSALAVAVAILRKRTLAKPPPAVYAWGTAVAWMVLSALWAMNESTAVASVIAYLQLFGLFAVVSLYPMTRNDYLFLVSALVLGGFVAAGAGALLYSSGQDVVNGRLLVAVNGHAIDENHNAATLLMPLAFALVAALRTRNFLRQVGLACMAATIAAEILLTASRGGFLAMIVLLGVLWWRTRYKLELGLGFVAVGIGASASFLSKRVDDLVSSSGSGGRFEIWSSAWQAFKEHWLTGVGIGNFQEAYDSVYTEVYHATYLHWHMVAHDIVAQTGVELGIVGLVLIAIAWMSVLRDPRGSWKQDPFADWWRAAQAGVAGLLCAALFLDLAWYKDVWMGFMLAVAAKNVLRWREEAARAARLAALQQQAEAAAQPVPPPPAMPQFDATPRAVPLLQR